MTVTGLKYLVGNFKHLHVTLIINCGQVDLKHSENLTELRGGCIWGGVRWLLIVLFHNPSQKVFLVTAPYPSGNSSLASFSPLKCLTLEISHPITKGFRYLYMWYSNLHFCGQKMGGGGTHRHVTWFYSFFQPYITNSKYYFLLNVGSFHDNGYKSVKIAHIHLYPVRNQVLWIIWILFLYHYRKLCVMIKHCEFLNPT